MDEYHGQFGQDKWLNENLFLNKKGLIFVEIGAAHPIQGMVFVSMLENLPAMSLRK